MNIILTRHRPGSGSVALIGSFRPNVRFPETQKPFPPCTTRSLGRPKGSAAAAAAAVIIVSGKELITESGFLSDNRSGVLERQQTTLEEELVGGHHGVVGNGKLEVGGDRSGVVPGGLEDLRAGMEGFGEVVGEGNAGAHGRVNGGLGVVGALLMMMMVIVHDDDGEFV